VFECGTCICLHDSTSRLRLCVCVPFPPPVGTSGAAGQSCPCLCVSLSLSLFVSVHVCACLCMCVCACVCVWSTYCNGTQSTGCHGAVPALLVLQRVLRGLTLSTDQLRHRRASAPTCRRCDMGARDGRHTVGCPSRAHHRDRRCQHDVLDGWPRSESLQRRLAEHRRRCKCDLVSTLSIKGTEPVRTAPPHHRGEVSLQGPGFWPRIKVPSPTLMRGRVAPY